MAATFQNVNVFFRTVVLLALVLLAGWWTLMLRGKLDASEHLLAQRSAELESARADVEKRQQEIQRLGSELKLRDQEIQRLHMVVAEQEKQIQALTLANRLLKVSHRVALG